MLSILRHLKFCLSFCFAGFSVNNRSCVLFIDQNVFGGWELTALPILQQKEKGTERKEVDGKGRRKRGGEVVGNQG